MRLNQLRTSAKLNESVEDRYIFKAIFMAGSPGSGKSTVRNQLFGGMGLKVVDADEIRRAFLALGRGGDYEVYGRMVRQQRQSYIGQRKGVIFDTTAWWLPSIADTKFELEQLGYDVGMVYVWTPLEQALDRVTKRAAATGREVPREEVVKRYKALRDNIRDYTEMFGDSFWYVDNSGLHPDISKVKRSITSWLNASPDNPVAVDWIQQELTKKRERLTR